MSRAERSSAAGRAAREKGDLREAARRVGDAFARYERAGDREGMARTLVDVALIALDGNDEDTAARALGEAVALIANDSDSPTRSPVVALAITGASRLAGVGHDHETALRLYAGAEAFATGAELDDIRVQVGGSVVTDGRAALGPTAVDAMLAAGRDQDPAGVLALAAARCAR